MARQHSTARPLRAQAPIRDVAARAGVSIATVSRVMNGITNKAAPATVERVRRAADELGYRAVSVGRALRQRQSRLVALLASNLANPAMAAIAASAEVALRHAGYVMTLCDTHDTAELQDEYLLEMRAQLVRATVLLGAVPSAKLREFSNADEPLLFVNRRRPHDGKGMFVGIDNRAAGGDVADLFAARAITAPRVIHGDLKSSATADRIAAFRARMKQHGVNLDDAAIMTADGMDHLAIGYQAMRRILESGARPRGVFCTSDLIAYGAARRAREMGIAAPHGLLIVGFDDNPLNDWVAPWLSSVRVPYERYGSAIVSALHSLWDGGAHDATILEHQLVVRGAA
jgi:LacI family transcriptional regulator